MVYLTIFTVVATVVSVFINILQLMRRRDIIKNFISHSQAQYNNFYRIDAWCRGAVTAKETGDLKLQRAIQHVHSAIGISEGVRNQIVAFCREYLGRVPRQEKPDAPIPEPLPEVGVSAS